MFATSLSILRHALETMRRNPRLLVFPFLGVIVALLLHVLLHAVADADEARWHGASWFAAIIYHYLGVFLITFVNMALYSEVIEALNGDAVRIARGIATARTRLRPIVGWSLAVVAMELALDAIDELTGLPGSWLGPAVRLAWIAACLFVIPVILLESRSRSPLAYLTISATLLKRVWREGLTGLGIIGTVGMSIVILILALSLVAAYWSGSMENQMYALTWLVNLGMLSSLWLLCQAFVCGLYLYATHGVAPGLVDDRTSDTVWSARQELHEQAINRP